MAWFYNSDSGKLVHEDPPSPGFYVYEAALHSGTGWHELPVPDSDSYAQASAYVKKTYAAGVSNSIGQAAGKEAQNLPGQVAGGTVNAATGDVLGMFGQSNLWIRVAKVIIGGAILLIGIAHVTGMSNTVGEIARKAPLPV